MKNLPLGYARAGLGLAAVIALQTAASAQFDAQVDLIHVTQAIRVGGTPLTGDRTTYVRASTLLTNPPTDPVALDGILRVYVSGVEVPESPIFSINGPYPARTSPNFSNEDHTLNFIYLPPVSNNVVFEVEINPAGPNFVPETNTSNNTGSTPVLNFQERGIPEFAYALIDYRPSGGSTPNLPPDSLTKPGKGDNFIQGIFPVSDVEYHRTDAASKLWTSSLSGTGTGLLNSLAADVQLMNPKPDFLYGWVPGGLPYNGQSYLNSSVSMGNTQGFKCQRTYAHEVGHNIGRVHVTTLIGMIGVDVEHHLNLPLSNNLPVLKPSNLNDIMVPGLNTNQAWVASGMYNYIFNYWKFGPGPAPMKASLPSIFIAGVWNMETGEVEVPHLFELPSGEPSPPAAPEETAFVVRTYSGGDLVQQLPIARGTNTDSCATRDSEDSALPLTEVGLHAVLLQGQSPIDRLEITPAAGVEARSRTFVRSPNAPLVAFTTPGLDGDVSAGLINVAWNGSDADGDPITYYLRYSNDGYRFSPLASGITETELSVDLGDLPAFQDGVGFFQLIASDGLNTTVANSPSLRGSTRIYAAAAGNDPWVFMCTPDKDKVYQKGTTVILHSSGWDLEDNALRGSSIVWSSDLDGVVATDRITSYASFSVGTHQLTVTATDQDGQTASDTKQIVITDRGLPGAPAGPVVYCTPGTSAGGCQASISATGTPSATAPSGFTLDTTGGEGAKDGLFFYGTNGRQANSWGSGTSFQCAVPPVIRAGLLTGGGTSGQCDGSFSQDLNALWTAIPTKNPGSGAVVQAQCWYRDPLNTSNQTTSLSDAIEFTVQP